MKRPDPRAASSLVEALVALALATALLLALFEALIAGQREVARTADEVHFQSLAVRFLAAAAREPFEFLAAAPERGEPARAAWRDWSDRVLAPRDARTEVTAWREPLQDPDTVLLFVSVRWASAAGRGRRTATSVLLGRVWTRPTVSLATSLHR